MCCNHSKFLTRWLYHRVRRTKDAGGMANSEDPDQTEQYDLSILPVLKLRAITVACNFAIQFHQRKKKKKKKGLRASRPLKGHHWALFRNGPPLRIV